MDESNVVIHNAATTTAATSSQTMTQVSPDQIFQMVTGFWVSKTLMTAVELEVFTKISHNNSGSGTVNFNQLQDILEMEQRPAEVFVTALASLGLLKITK